MSSVARLTPFGGARDRVVQVASGDDDVPVVLRCNILSSCGLSTSEVLLPFASWTVPCNTLLSLSLSLSPSLSLQLSFQSHLAPFLFVAPVFRSTGVQHLRRVVFLSVSCAFERQTLPAPKSPKPVLTSSSYQSPTRVRILEESS